MARTRFSRSRSAVVSSPTWGSPTSSRRRSIPTTSGSRGAAWSSSKRTIQDSSIAARRPRSWCTSSPRPAIRFSICKVPANRIIGGYTVKDGVIIPNYSHAEIIEAVFRRTRVTVGLMTSAKLLSAPEPIIRYQRQRFRGGASTSPGTPRYDLGLQQKEDCLHRLVDIWATGEAGSALGLRCRTPVRRFRCDRKRQGTHLRRTGDQGPCRS